MAIHELATNSAKYGALSVASGKVRVEWSLNGGQKGRKFRLGWTETGGPPVTQPSRHGFGSVLIVDLPRSVLNDYVDLEFLVEGVLWGVETALDEIVEKDV
jgi:two-component sensor histidine kinase